MQKASLGPSVSLYPVPAVLVSCTDGAGRPNIITIAWAGIVCSEPPILSISIRPKHRHSYALVKQSNEFVINIPRQDQLRLTDWCGTVSGKDVDKFEEAGLTAVPASHVRAPLIGECPVNVECVVNHRLALGTHDVFLGEVVAVHADEDMRDDRGRLDMAKVMPIAFCEGAYYAVGERIGSYGFSKGRLTPDA
jgi:flavin reductase (DIM6/NTAB) family NADH-FMN oxidoreductase RutF